MRSLVDRRPFASFVAVTLAFSWSVWLLAFLALEGRAAGFAAVVVGGFGPPVGAVAVVHLRGGDVGDWLRAQLLDAAAPAWFLLALAIPLVFVAAETGYLVATGATLDLGLVVDRLPAFLGSLVFVFFLGGGQEELGWRAFALPELQARYDGLVASLVIGVVWAVWHLPLYVLPGAIYASEPFVTYVPLVVAFAFVYTWLYNAAGRALPVVVLLHAATNSHSVLVPVPMEAIQGAMGGATSHAIVFGATVAVLAAILLVADPRSLGHRARTAASGDGPDRTVGHGGS